MLEFLALPALLESGVLPVAAGWLASEVIGLNPKTKSNSVVQLLVRIAGAVVKELTVAEPTVPATEPTDSVAPPAPEPAEEPEPVKRAKRATRKRATKAAGTAGTATRKRVNQYK